MSLIPSDNKTRTKTFVEKIFLERGMREIAVGIFGIVLATAPVKRKMCWTNNRLNEIAHSANLARIVKQCLEIFKN